MSTAIIYILISTLGGAVGQILLKKGMGSMGPLTLTLESLPGMVWRMATNPYVFFGLVIYMVGVLFWLTALSRVDLSFAYPFASLSYVLMLIAAWLLFHENITVTRLIGTIVIVAGVLIISRG